MYICYKDNNISTEYNKKKNIQLVWNSNEFSIEKLKKTDKVER